MPLDTERLESHRLENVVQSIVLVAAMLLLLALLGGAVAGRAGMVWALVLGGVSALMAPRLSPRLVLRMYGGRELFPSEAVDLQRAVAELARRAGLRAPPRLAYVPSAVPNAFAVGRAGDAAIVVTAGLLQRLDLRELVAVLAHELSHVASGDVALLGLADVVGRVTRLLSMAGTILLLLNLPLVLFGAVTIPWWLVLLLLAAPSATAFLQLALSRTREYHADVAAARLTGDPLALASALRKLHPPVSWLRRILMPGHHVPEPSMLRTHPSTEARVARLRAIAGAMGARAVHPLSVPAPRTSRYAS